MFRVAIVEDEAGAASQLQENLQRFSQENDIPVQVEIFPDGAKLVGEYRHVWDLLLLDIDMPVMNGLETARTIRETDPDVMIIFITNLAQYAIQGYEVDALDYVLKPVNYFALAMKLKRALRVLRASESGALMLRRGGDLTRMPLSRIYYVESFNHSLKYHTADGDLETTGAQTLASLEKELVPQGFVRCHNCYLANLRYVDGIHGNTLSVLGQELPISRNRRRDVMDAMLNYAKGSKP